MPPVTQDERPAAPSQAHTPCALYEDYYERLVRFLTSYTKERATAEDLAQDTLLKVVQQPEILDPTRPAWPWLKKVARNLAIDHVRSSARRRRIVEHQLARLSSWENGVDEIGRIDDRALLSQALREIPVRQRTALGLRYLLGFTPAEVAAELETNPNAAHQLLHRAHRSLRSGRWLGEGLAR